MRNFDFEFDEFKKFVDAVEVGGLRKDAKYDAFAILAAAGEDVILDKYDAMSDSQKKNGVKRQDKLFTLIAKAILIISLTIFKDLFDLFTISVYGEGIAEYEYNFGG